MPETSEQLDETVQVQTLWTHGDPSELVFIFVSYMKLTLGSSDLKSCTVGSLTALRGPECGEQLELRASCFFLFEEDGVDVFSLRKRRMEWTSSPDGGSSWSFFASSEEQLEHPTGSQYVRAVEGSQEVHKEFELLQVCLFFFCQTHVHQIYSLRLWLQEQSRPPCLAFVDLQKTACMAQSA